MSDNWLYDLVTKATKILDAGCGPNGAAWWEYKPESTYMLAIDLLYEPPKLPPNTSFVKGEVADYCETTDKTDFFDLIIADHLLEHVENPERTAIAFNRVLGMGGIVHVAVPDATNFTDRFYRLIHPEGGGHINQFDLDQLLKLMNDAGFECREYRPMGDDWSWFRLLYDWKTRGIQFITQEEIDYIAEVFVKELTPEKGYFYGWEGIFVKQRVVPTTTSSSNQPKELSAEIENLPQENIEVPQSVSEHNYDFSPAELTELRWLAYWAQRFKQTRMYGYLRWLVRRLE